MCTSLRRGRPVGRVLLTAISLAILVGSGGGGCDAIDLWTFWSPFSTITLNIPLGLYGSAGILNPTGGTVLTGTDTAAGTDAAASTPGGIAPPVLSTSSETTTGQRAS